MICWRWRRVIVSADEVIQKFLERRIGFSSTVFTERCHGCADRGLQDSALARHLAILPFSNERDFLPNESDWIIRGFTVSLTDQFTNLTPDLPQPGV